MFYSLEFVNNEELVWTDSVWISTSVEEEEYNRLPMSFEVMDLIVQDLRQNEEASGA